MVAVRFCDCKRTFAGLTERLSAIRLPIGIVTTALERIHVLCADALCTARESGVGLTWTAVTGDNIERDAHKPYAFTL